MKHVLAFVLTILSSAALADDCAEKFVGDWMVTLNTGQRFVGHHLPNGVMTADCPACGPGTWTCQGNTIFKKAPWVSYSGTLSADGNTITEPYGVLTRISPPPPSVAVTPPSVNAPSPPAGVTTPTAPATSSTAKIRTPQINTPLATVHVHTVHTRTPSTPTVRVPTTNAPAPSVKIRTPRVATPTVHAHAIRTSTPAIRTPSPTTPAK